MARWSGTSEQRDAARTKAMLATGSAEPYAPAVERYLRLQSTEGRSTPAGPGHLTRDGYGLWHGHHTTGPLRHEHVVINGHNVEITEDDVGVAELHLE